MHVSDNEVRRDWHCLNGAMSDKPHVVVLGAGFGGVAATRELARAGYRVTVVDRHAYNTFQPLLYQVATGGLNPGDVTYSLRYLSARHHAARFRRAEVVGIDHEAREIHCADGVKINFDYLIIGTGVTVNHFGIPGAAEHSMSMYTRADALQVRDTIFGGLETIAGMSDPGTGSFTVVVVGGGATGVEMAGSLAELRSSAVPKVYPELDPNRVQVILVEMAGQLLTPFKEKLQRYTLRVLTKRGVDVRLNTAIAQVHADRVVLNSGESIYADLVVWAAGIAGDPTVANWDLPIGRGGRIEVGPDLRVTGQERIFAIGDGSVVVDNPLPQLAQPAIQMGRHAVRQITLLEHGQPTEGFAYHDKGIMATIGKQAAVVELPVGITMTGTLAWLGWIALHIVTLLGGRNRIQTLVNLASRYIAWPREAGAIVGDVRENPAIRAHVARDRAEAAEVEES